jgi:hypothetical protein
MNLEQIAEKLKATGMVHVVRSNERGEVLEEFDVPNLVVTTGRNYIAAKMVAITNSPVSMTHMAIGTGTGTPAAANTSLGTEVGRVTLSAATSSANAVTYTATFPAGTGTGAITEAGVFNAGTAGTMLCRTTFPVVNKQSGDSIAITWVVTVS